MKSKCNECNAVIEFPRPRKFCNIECKAAFQRRARPVSNDWLRQRYVVEGVSANDMAREIGRDPKRVWEWLKEAGIETRPRGSYLKGRFEKGHASFIGKTHTPEAREKIKQARLRDGGVPYKQDGRHWLEGKPQGTVASWKGGITPERQAFYASEEWAIAVKQVWKRDHAICQRCEAPHSLAKSKGVKFHIHHIESFAVKEKRALLSNLLLVCETCHRWIHSKGNSKREFIQ